MKMLSSLFISIAFIYISLCIILFFTQESYIFFPPEENKSWYQQVKKFEYFISTNEAILHGWNFTNSNINHDTSIIYFGGNAEDVAYNLQDAHMYSVKNLFFTNLPGYGKSTGKPSEKNFFASALQAYDEIVKINQLKPENIIIMGRSLGSSVATYIASQRKSHGLILITPFDSLENIAAKIYRIFPVKLLLKHKFKTIDYIDDVSSPILIISAQNDEIVPVENLNNLLKAREDGVNYFQIPHANHNDIAVSPEYFTHINRFILTLAVFNDG